MFADDAGVCTSGSAGVRGMVVNGRDSAGMDGSGFGTGAGLVMVS